MADETFQRLDALLAVAMRLAGSTPSGRVGLASLARSTPSEWIPQPWGTAIVAELQAAGEAAAAPMPFARVERRLREAWGAPPSQELDELEPEPWRVTPVVQVHRGRLEGRPVAVRVLRQDMLRSVRQDLALLDGLAGPLGAAFPAIDAAAVLREVRERVLDDLDLDSQAGAQRRFHRALREHPLFLVPAPVTSLCHEQVLVSEWVDGVPLEAARDPDGAAARLVLFACGAAHWGTAHADLDPSEVLELTDGRIAVIGFGATRSVDGERIGLGEQLISAFAAGDDAALGTALQALGWLPAEQAAAAAELTRRSLGPLAGSGPSRLDSEAVVVARERLLAEPRALINLMLALRLVPRDLWPARGLGQLFGTIARVGATGSWLELVQRGLRDGWAAQLPD